MLVTRRRRQRDSGPVEQALRFSMSRGNKSSTAAVLSDTRAKVVRRELFALWSLAPSPAVILFYLPAQSH
jgi:hypothetical protein